jgi:hypothetical protein
LYSSNPSSLPNHARDAALAKQHNLQTVSKVDIDELARESDVLFVLAPGGGETYHIVDETLLRKMKKTSILVNASRGTLVDSDALAKALREGWIWAAGLDVVEGEPNITIDHPLVKEPKSVPDLIVSAVLIFAVQMCDSASYCKCYTGNSSRNGNSCCTESDWGDTGMGDAFSGQSVQYIVTVNCKLVEWTSCSRITQCQMTQG